MGRVLRVRVVLLVCVIWGNVMRRKLMGVAEVEVEFEVRVDVMASCLYIHTDIHTDGHACIHRIHTTITQFINARMHRRDFFVTHLICPGDNLSLILPKIICQRVKPNKQRARKALLLWRMVLLHHTLAYHLHLSPNHLNFQ